MDEARPEKNALADSSTTIDQHVQEVTHAPQGVALSIMLEKEIKHLEHVSEPLLLPSSPIPVGSSRRASPPSSSTPPSPRMSMSDVQKRKGWTPEQIHISLTQKASEMMVMWVTRSATETSVVRYSRGQKNDDSSDEEDSATPPTQSKTVAYKTEIGTSQLVQLGDKWSGFVHQVKLTHLSPDTIYEYRVGDEKSGKWSDEYSFKTRPSSPSAFTCVTFADFDTVNEIQKHRTVMARLRENLSEFDFILVFGDLSYADGDPLVWDNFFNHIQPVAACKPWMVSCGNHEREGDELQFKVFETRFKMPGKSNFWYSFNYGYAHFVIVSTEHSLEVGSPQYEWLLKDLERANRNRHDVPWLIVSGHRALYGSNKRWFYKDKAKKIRDALCPIFDTYHVDLAIFGHCHAYERTHPILNNEVDPRGTVYLLAGVAGAELDKEWEPQPQWSAYRTAHHGYGVLHVKNQKKLRFCYHRERDGKMWDAFSLKKKDNDKVEVRYDYENKFLKNWTNLSVTDEKVKAADAKKEPEPESSIATVSSRSNTPYPAGLTSSGTHYQYQQHHSAHSSTSATPKSRSSSDTPVPFVLSGNGSGETPPPPPPPAPRTDTPGHFRRTVQSPAIGKPLLAVHHDFAGHNQVSSPLRAAPKTDEKPPEQASSVPQTVSPVPPTVYLSEPISLTDITEKVDESSIASQSSQDLPAPVPTKHSNIPRLKVLDDYS